MDTIDVSSERQPGYQQGSNSTMTETEPKTSTWTIDSSRSNATFSVRNKVFGLFSFTVNGVLSEMRGTITIDEASPSNSKVVLSLPSASMSTKMKPRDKHLRSGDFFDVENHPEITFASTAIVPVDAAAGKYRVTGELTVRGITNLVELEVSYSAPRPNARERRIIITGSTTVKRQMFGMTWTSFRGNPADDALLTASLEAVLSK